ncbi:MAG: hypothetical protein JO159_02000 [Acidobacteria bacterium]|nr:hypothetical protein [Acidobacteriota bacterium]MBV9623306.1 hypothetical protein [Acidobacteriota bacterium]
MLPSNNTLSLADGSPGPAPEPRSRAKIRWHAPDEIAEPQTFVDTASLPLSDVRSCTSCGFPVSEIRALCLDCEQNAAGSGLAAPLVHSFAEESWIQTHGYTIASLLVTLVTSAIIWWLRR